MTRKTRNHRPAPRKTAGGREVFDSAPEFVALRDLRISGVRVAAGEGIDKSGVSARRLEQMFEARLIGLAPGHVPTKKLPRPVAVGPTDVMADIARVVAEQGGGPPPGPALRRGLPRVRSRRAEAPA